jgi:hypothetical protein
MAVAFKVVWGGWALRLIRSLVTDSSSSSSFLPPSNSNVKKTKKSFLIPKIINAFVREEKKKKRLTSTLDERICRSGTSQPNKNYF